MRTFLYYSAKARTTGNFRTDNLMKAGRLDIACNVIIMTFFVSHHTRENVKLHLVFDGPPDSPKHLELFPGGNMVVETESKIDISKKDIAGLIKRLLYKYKKGIKNEVAPGYFIEKKSFEKVVEELIESGKKVYVLERRGEDIRKLKDKDLEDAVFIIGDQDGIPKDKMKKLKNLGVEKISVGRQMYFASQTVTVIQNELDYRGI